MAPVARPVEKVRSARVTRIVRGVPVARLDSLFVAEPVAWVEKAETTARTPGLWAESASAKLKEAQAVRAEIQGERAARATWVPTERLAPMVSRAWVE
jgi:hypothetical protein